MTDPLTNDESDNVITLKLTADGHNNANSVLSLSKIKELKAVDTEFINKYESLPALWDVNHRDYNNKYVRYEGLEQMLAIIKKYDPEMTMYHVRKKINCLRSNYRKELKKHLASKRIGSNGEEYYAFVPSNWKFYALRFLGGEVELENVKQEEVAYEEEVDFDNLDETCDVLEEDNLSSKEESITYQNRYSTPMNDPPKHKKPKREHKEYINMNDISDMELKAVAANVVCKLKRMNSEQRCQAELLINKVLYHGLKSNLTANTDLAEVEQT